MRKIKLTKGQVAHEFNDVGVDSWNFTPVSFEQVEAAMLEKELNRRT